MKRQSIVCRRRVADNTRVCYSAIRSVLGFLNVKEPTAVFLIHSESVQSVDFRLVYRDITLRRSRSVRSESGTMRG